MNGPQNLSDDLKELVALLKSHKVEFLIVGAHALSFYGVTRFTQDLDVFLNRTAENIARLKDALGEFGIEMTAEAEVALIDKPRGMVVLGHQPNRIDLLNFLSGVDFESAATRTTIGKLADLEVGYISMLDYIATKRAANRPKDIDDLNRLAEALGGTLPNFG